eukprot:5740932-Karenia_brevis.AAC.1
MHRRCRRETSCALIFFFVPQYDFSWHLHLCRHGVTATPIGNHSVRFKGSKSAVEADDDDDDDDDDD